MNQNLKRNFNLELVAFVFAAIFFLGMIGCSGKEKHSIKLSEPKIVDSNKMSRGLNEFSTNSTIGADYILRFAPGDSANHIKIKSRCWLNAQGASDDFKGEWDRSFKTEMRFSELIPHEMIRKYATAQGLPSSDQGLQCEFNFIAFGEAGSTHSFEISKRPFDASSFTSTIQLDKSFAENANALQIGLKQIGAESRVGFICSGDLAESFAFGMIESAALINSDSVAHALTSLKNSGAINWFNGQQVCRVAFTDGDKVIYAISPAVTARVPARNVSATFIPERISEQNPGFDNRFKLGKIVVSNLSDQPIVISSKSIPEKLFRYITFQGSFNSGSNTAQLNGAYFVSDKAQTFLVPTLSSDHQNSDGSIDVYVGSYSTGSIEVFGVDPRLDCSRGGAAPRTMAIVTFLRNQMDSALGIYVAGTTPGIIGYQKKELIHQLAISEDSEMSVFAHASVANRFQPNPAVIFQNNRMREQPARCVNGIQQ